VTTLDMDALSLRQREVLGEIAIGQDGGHNKRILQVLAEKGLIVGYQQALPGHPPVTVTRWEVPLDVHIQWCEWCTQRVDEEGQ
jgi:hypothetical protein